MRLPEEPIWSNLTPLPLSVEEAIKAAIETPVDYAETFRQRQPTWWPTGFSDTLSDEEFRHHWYSNLQVLVSLEEHNRIMDRAKRMGLPLPYEGPLRSFKEPKC